MLASADPGTSAAWQERVADLGSYAQWSGQIRMKKHGRVKRWFGKPSVTYEPTRARGWLANERRAPA